MTRPAPNRRQLLIVIPVLSLGLAGCGGMFRRPPAPPPAATVTTTPVLFEESFTDEAWHTRWVEHSIDGHTQYARATDNGAAYLHAESRDTASYLAYPQAFRPQEFPHIAWRWRVLAPLPQENLRRKDGSDVAARLYLLFDTGPMPWQRRLVTYVWSSALPKGTQLFSAYSSQAGIIVVRDAADIGQWQTETRDILEDYRALFHEEPVHVDGIALMTDADNTNATAAADFDDVRVYR